MKTRIFQKHARDCHALVMVARGALTTAWSLIEDDQGFRANAAGVVSYTDRTNPYRWLIAICEDSDCPARIAIREQDILEALPLGAMPKPKRGRANKDEKTETNKTTKEAMNDIRS